MEKKTQDKFVMYAAYIVGVVVVVSSSCCCIAMAQAPAPSPTAAAANEQALNALLQGYAFKALSGRPRTGSIYKGEVPANLTGIVVYAQRLRSGSLRRRGDPSYQEFSIPTGVLVQPYVERIVLVYQNLGNWSKYYYPLPGYTYLAPLLGLLPYDAVNLSATGLPELTLVASGSPISITFANVGAVPLGAAAQCVWFDLDGVPQLQPLVRSNVCSTYRRGHFGIVANFTPAPSPAPVPGHAPAAPLPPPAVPPPAQQAKKPSSNVWKIAVGVVGGLLALGLLAGLVVCLQRYSQERKLQELDRRSEAGEALRIAPVGPTQVPVAYGTRTQPVIENEYVA